MVLIENETLEKTLLIEPVFFRIYLEEDKKNLDQLLKDRPQIKIHDQISTQLDDLIKSKHPKKKPEPDEMERLKMLHIGTYSLQEYGVWVYYPWSDRLVHLLDEQEFIEMRTNRNIYKITPQERDILGKQKVGVVGLSVGQSISITMAMERGFGEIRLADFDLLELTNLNRIRTGVHNLGLPKVVIVAREIKEIDPFLKVTIFDDGMTEENMDRFFLEGGKLDVIVDECDGLDIKILLRHKAKSLGVPVVMDASDKGTLDVERFDLEPERAILHGLIDHLDHRQVKYLKTNEDKIPFLLPMVGVQTSSDRLKASMIEVGQSITTWPQLASAVALGGALGADVCRRIALDQFHDSGRYFVDLEEIISDKVKPQDAFYNAIDLKAPELTVDEMVKIADNFSPNSQPNIILEPETVKQLVESAGLAPSGGNSQPWKFLYYKKRLYLFHDENQSISWMDFQNTASYIGLGAAIENLKIKASTLGMQTMYQPFPAGLNERLVAAFDFTQVTTDSHLNKLAAGIGLRLTNRKKGNLQKISDTVLTSIQESVSHSSLATLEIVDIPEQIVKLANLVSSVERLRFLHPQGHHDLFTKEIKWPSPTGEPILEGIDINTLELSESDKTGMMVAAKPEVVTLLNHWGGGTAFEKISKGAVASSSAIGMITMPERTSENFLRGGEALQRAWITANLNNVAFQPISGTLFVFDRFTQTNGDDMSTSMIEELTILKRELHTIFPVLNHRCGIFMFRMSFADEASSRSLKRPLEDILNFY
jgi:tRNA A37 threonylcarbamoyladenosine dehydratase